MKFPIWARGDSRNKLKFLCNLMALHVSSDGQVLGLSEASGVPYSTLRRAIYTGRMTYRVARRVARSAPLSGVKAIWLVAPEEINLNSDGEVEE